MKEWPNLRTALRIAAAMATGVTAVQFVVWVLVCSIGTRLENPWWLWTGYAAVALIVAERWVSRSTKKSDVDSWEAR